jgi:hypothetical protein
MISPTKSIGSLLNMYSTPSILGRHFGRIGGKERKEMALWDILLKFKDQTI